MGLNKPHPDSKPTNIEQAWVEGDEIQVVSEVVRKYARVLDMTDSGRDIKPLASGMFEAMDRLSALQANQPDNETALSQLLREAEQALSNAR